MSGRRLYEVMRAIERAEAKEHIKPALLLNKRKSVAPVRLDSQKVRGTIITKYAKYNANIRR